MHVVDRSLKRSTCCTVWLEKGEGTSHNAHGGEGGDIISTRPFALCMCDQQIQTHVWKSHIGSRVVAIKKTNERMLTDILTTTMPQALRDLSPRGYRIWAPH